MYLARIGEEKLSPAGGVPNALRQVERYLSAYNVNYLEAVVPVRRNVAALVLREVKAHLYVGVAGNYLVPHFGGGICFFGVV